MKGYISSLCFIKSYFPDSNIYIEATLICEIPPVMWQNTKDFLKSFIKFLLCFMRDNLHLK